MNKFKFLFSGYDKVNYVKLTFIKFWTSTILLLLSILNFIESLIMHKPLNVEMYVAISLVIIFLDLAYLKNTMMQLKKISIKYWMLIIGISLFFGISNGLINLNMHSEASAAGPLFFIIIFISLIRAYSNEYIFRALYKKWILDKKKYVYYLIQLFSPTLLILLNMLIVEDKNYIFIILKILIHIIFVYVLVFFETKSKNSELNFLVHYFSIVVAALIWTYPYSI